MSLAVQAGCGNALWAFPYNECIWVILAGEIGFNALDMMGTTFCT